MTNAQLSPGTELGRYELLLPIAKGGMAQVWAARLIGTRGFTKLVAIKTILPGGMDDTRLEQMFMAEASLAAQVHHPNVVETIELGEHDGTLYLTMEWVEGEPLHYVQARAQGRGGMPLTFAVNLIGQACRGLHAAHELRGDSGELLGVVHRDVSPQNILVGYGGTAKLVDFGIAKATARNAGLTEVGELKGKVSFMSPEQLKGQPLDRRTDVFALGIVLFELSTGRHPFKGGHPAETMRRICVDEPPPWLTTKTCDYSLELRRVVERALARDPQQRWASAEEMLFALQRALPQAFEPDIDSKLKIYLDGLLGERARERRAAVRLAQETVDRAKAQSCGSLRALTLDSAADIHELSSGALVALPDSSSQRSARRVATPITHEPSRMRPLMVAAAAASAAAFALGTLVALRSAPQPPTPSPVTAAQAVSPVVLPTVSASSVPVVAVPSAAPSASATAARAEKSRSWRAVAAPPPLRKGGESPASTASERSPPAKPSGGNAWDPQSFGSRH